MPLEHVVDSRDPIMVAGIINDLRIINGQRGKVAIFKLDDKSGTLEFSEYQSMIADWDNVVKTIDEETARIERAKAAAAPQAFPASWDAAAPSGPTESAPAPA
jgi:hypothetical protein